MGKKGVFRFRENELARAIRAADKAGKEISVIHIDRDGELTLEVTKRSGPEDQGKESRRASATSEAASEKTAA